MWRGPRYRIGLIAPKRHWRRRDRAAAVERRGAPAIARGGGQSHDRQPGSVHPRQWHGNGAAKKHALIGNSSLADLRRGGPYARRFAFQERSFAAAA